MSAGARSELVEFVREVRTRRVGGGQDSSWVSLGQMWAKVEWLRSGEANETGAVRERPIYKFTVPSAHVEAIALSPADRIVFAAEMYDIRERPRRLVASPLCTLVAEHIGVAPIPPGGVYPPYSAASHEW